MALVENKKFTFKKCKNFIIENGYFIGLSGQQAVCYDSEFKLVSSVDKLRYVYHGEISPDGKKILLASTENRFSIHKLPDLELICKATVKSPYNGNLEGNACWSFDNKKILLCALNDETINSSLKIFDVCNGKFEGDLLKEKYWLMHIIRIEAKKRYLMVGFNRKDLKTYLIWFDGIDFSEFCLEGCNDIVSKVRYNELNDCIDVLSNNSLTRYDCNGKKLKFISFYLSEKDELDSIMDVCISNDKSVAYIATLNGISVLDIKSNKVIDKLEIEYGVNKISEISNCNIIVSTWNGARIFEYC